MANGQAENGQDFEKLVELTEEVKVCMFTTVKDDGEITSRPMQLIKAEDGNLWFFTNEYSEKVDEISKDNIVYLIFSHPGKNTYVHVKGKATVVTDKEKIKQLWSPIVKAWFPEGVDDPQLALLKVDPSEASYWNSSENKLVVFYGILKAIAKGEEFKNGEFGKLDL